MMTCIDIHKSVYELLAIIIEAEVPFHQSEGHLCLPLFVKAACLENVRKIAERTQA